ncbi:Uncharacterised protein [Raoultella terrigena]|uniref:Uncharacterized protein n=1 Tax=Raoultella terrigena TaxID=577 RepID=A0A7Z8ZD24_RAOTE|nr:Uncharacterised protein [Raoultella terrigena]
MHDEVMKTKRFEQNVQCAKWYVNEANIIMDDAYKTDEEKLAALEDLHDRALTLATPFLVAVNETKTKMEALK